MLYRILVGESCNYFIFYLLKNPKCFKMFCSSLSCEGAEHTAVRRLFSNDGLMKIHFFFFPGAFWCAQMWWPVALTFQKCTGCCSMTHPAVPGTASDPEILFVWSRYCAGQESVRNKKLHKTHLITSWRLISENTQSNAGAREAETVQILLLVVWIEMTLWGVCVCQVGDCLTLG